MHVDHASNRSAIAAEDVSAWMATPIMNPTLDATTCPSLNLPHFCPDPTPRPEPKG